MPGSLIHRVAYTSEDQAGARAALSCHKSQFSPEMMQQIEALSETVNGGTMYLRAWAGGPKRTDLFVR